MDLEQGQVVDLLSERSAHSFAAWLREHGEVEIITRDRCGLYADGANQGAPSAEQVADRYHLVSNLDEALERDVQRLQLEARAALGEAIDTKGRAGESEPPPNAWQERLDGPSKTLVREIGTVNTTELPISGPFAWVPDIDRIAFVRSGNDGDTLTTIPRTGGPEQKLFTAHGIDQVAWSPDKQHRLCGLRSGAVSRHFTFRPVNPGKIDRNSVRCSGFLGVGVIMSTRWPLLLSLSLVIVQAQGPPGGDRLPACPEGPLFQVIPMELDDFIAFRPLGFITIPTHFFPAKHSSFTLARPGEAPPVRTVRFPGDAWVVQILSTKFSSGATGYQLQFQPCDKVRSYFYHLKEISSTLQLAFDAAGKRCFDQTFPDGTVTKCEARLMEKVSAGEVAGMSGDGSAGVDFGLVDFRLEPSGFVNLDHYTFDYPYFASPLDYYPSALRELFERKLGSWDGEVRRTADPKAGTHRIDIAGTAQGGWFFPGSDMRASPDDMTRHLALVHDYIDPQQPLFVMGTTVAGMKMGIYTFVPADEGSVNRRFKEVTPEGGIFCYEGAEGSRSVGRLPLSRWEGVLLIRMEDQNTLLVEQQGNGESKCNALAPWQMTSRAVRFAR
jgi:hypothetical protein